MQDLRNKKIVGEAGAGLVRIICNGLGEISKVEIDDSIFTKEDKQFISDLFIAALHSANKQVAECVYAARATQLYQQYAGEGYDPNHQ